MKKMRKYLVLALSLILALSLSAPALAYWSASNPEDIAAEYLALLDQDGIEYYDMGFDSDGDYWIIILHPGDPREEHEINLYIDGNGRGFSAYEWYLMEYDPWQIDTVLETINDLNGAYRFVTFWADDSDDTLTAETHGSLQGDAEESALLLYAAVEYLPLVVDHAWYELQASVPTGGEPEEDAGVVGTWKFSTMTFTAEAGGQSSGTVLTAEDFGTTDVFVMELKETGEMAVRSFGIKTEGTWTREGDTLTLTDETGDFTAELLLDGTLRLDASEDGGYLMILERAE